MDCSTMLAEMFRLRMTESFLSASGMTPMLANSSSMKRTWMGSLPPKSLYACSNILVNMRLKIIAPRKSKVEVLDVQTIL